MFIGVMSGLSRDHLVRIPKMTDNSYRAIGFALWHKKKHNLENNFLGIWQLIQWKLTNAPRMGKH